MSQGRLRKNLMIFYFLVISIFISFYLKNFLSSSTQINNLFHYPYYTAISILINIFFLLNLFSNKNITSSSIQKIISFFIIFFISLKQYQISQLSESYDSFIKITTFYSLPSIFFISSALILWFHSLLNFFLKDNEVKKELNNTIAIITLSLTTGSLFYILSSPSPPLFFILFNINIILISFFFFDIELLKEKKSFISNFVVFLIIVLSFKIIIKNNNEYKDDLIKKSSLAKEHILKITKEEEHSIKEIISKEDSFSKEKWTEENIFNKKSPLLMGILVSKKIDGKEEVWSLFQRPGVYLKKNTTNNHIKLSTSNKKGNYLYKKMKFKKNSDITFVLDLPLALSEIKKEYLINLYTMKENNKFEKKILELSPIILSLFHKKFLVSPANIHSFEIKYFINEISIILLSFFFSLFWSFSRKSIALLKQKNDLIQKNHQFLNTILENIPCGIFKTDEEGNCNFTNKFWHKITGIDFKEALNHGWAEALYREDKNFVLKKWEEYILDKKEFNEVYRFKNVKNKEISYISCKVIPLYNEEEKIIGHLGIINNLNKQKEDELKIKEEKDLFNNIIDNLPIGLYCRENIMGENKITIWNKKCLEIFGSSIYEINSKSSHNLSHDIAEHLLNQEKEEDEANEYQIDKSHESIYLNVPSNNYGEIAIKTKRQTIHKNKQRSIKVAIIEDITTELKKEKFMEEQKIKLTHAERLSSLGELSGGIAHEINNSLTVIDFNNKKLISLSAKKENDPQAIVHLAKQNSSQIIRITKIIKGLKAFARDSSNDPFELSTLKQIINESTDFCIDKFSKYNVELEITPYDESLEIECRPIQISQVILNLLNNSFDAISQLDKKWVNIQVKDNKEEDLVEIIITDSGSGISPEMAEKILTPFFTTKTVGKGSGMGLSLSLGIIKSHKGDLFLDMASRNTSFKIFLPKKQNQGQEDEEKGKRNA